MRALISLLPLVLLACEPEEQGVTKAEMPALPPLELRPVLPELQALIDAAPQPPGDERMAQLRDLIETAWLPDYASPRMQAMAERSLEEEKDIEWALEAGLHHEEANVRFHCARALGERERRAAIPLLLRQLRGTQYEKDVAVRCEMIRALVALDQFGAAGELSQWMLDSEWAQVAGRVAMEILKGGPELSESPTYDELRAGIDQAAWFWREAGTLVIPKRPEDKNKPIDPLLRARLAAHLHSLSGFNLRPVDDARFVFGAMGVIGLPLLGEALHAENSYLRNHSLEIVRALGPVAASLEADLLPLLDDPLGGPLAAAALGESRARGAYPHLAARLESPNLELRAAAAGALGALGDQRASDALLGLLADEQQPTDVRVQAAFSLALLDRGRSYLEGLLESGGYHQSTLRELLDRIDAERSR